MDKIPPEIIDYCEYRAAFAGTDEFDERKFELAINGARIGNIRKLFDYMEVNRFYEPPNFYLDNYNWQRELPRVKEYIKYLEELGL